MGIQDNYAWGDRLVFTIEVCYRFSSICCGKQINNNNKKFGWV